MVDDTPGNGRERVSHTEWRQFKHSRRIDELPAGRPRTEQHVKSAVWIQTQTCFFFFLFSSVELQDGHTDCAEKKIPSKTFNDNSNFIFRRNVPSRPPDDGPGRERQSRARLRVGNWEITVVAAGELTYAAVIAPVAYRRISGIPARLACITTSPLFEF